MLWLWTGGRVRCHITFYTKELSRLNHRLLPAFLAAQLTLTNKDTKAAELSVLVMERFAYYRGFAECEAILTAPVLTNSIL